MKSYKTDSEFLAHKDKFIKENQQLKKKLNKELNKYADIILEMNEKYEELMYNLEDNEDILEEYVDEPISEKWLDEIVDAWIPDEVADGLKYIANNEL